MLPKPAPEQPPRETFVFSRIATSLASSISASSMIAVSGRLAAGAPRGCFHQTQKVVRVAMDEEPLYYESTTNWPKLISWRCPSR